MHSSTTLSNYNHLLISHNCTKLKVIYDRASALLRRRPYVLRVMFFLSFSPPNLRGRSVDRHQILTCSRVSLIYKIWSEIYGPLLPKFWRPKIIKMLGTFRTTSQLDGEYLRNETRDIVKRKTVLQTAISAAHAYVTPWILLSLPLSLCPPLSLSLIKQIDKTQLYNRDKLVNV